MELSEHAERFKTTAKNHQSKLERLDRLYHPALNRKLPDVLPLSHLTYRSLSALS